MTSVESKTEYIRKRLLESRSEEELEEICAELKANPDIADGSVDAEKSKLKKKGAFQFKPETTKAVALNKQLPVEVLIKELTLPPMVNGTKHIFDSGVEYGMKSILIGVRVAQELSKMGIDQATPIIRMAQEMRQTEGQVAKETGIAMGGEIAGRMFDFLEQRLPQKSDTAKTEKPFEGIMNRTMEMMMQGMQAMLFGGSVAHMPGLIDERNQGGK